MGCKFEKKCPVYKELLVCNGDFLDRNYGLACDKNFCLNGEYKVKVNLGCGHNSVPGFINVDLRKLPGVDKVMDLNKKWKFNNNSIDFIYARGVVEHLYSIDKTMEEIYRVLKPKGIAFLVLPYYNSIMMSYDPQHRWFFNENTLNAYTYNFHLNYYSKARFKLRKIIMIRQTKVSRLIPRFIRLPISRMIGNIYGEMAFILEK